MKSFLTLSLILAGATLAQAHAFLDHADPRVGSTVASPRAVKIWFTEELASVRIEILDPTGREIDRHDVKIGPGDKTLASVSGPTLAPGTYKVIWHAVAFDTHHTQGSFSFTVK